MVAVAEPFLTLRLVGCVGEAPLGEEPSPDRLGSPVGVPAVSVQLVLVLPWASVKR